jgi:hypothetical protein
MPFSFVCSLEAVFRHGACAAKAFGTMSDDLPRVAKPAATTVARKIVHESEYSKLLSVTMWTARSECLCQLVFRVRRNPTVFSQFAME